jgi:hypothetical protein
VKRAEIVVAGTGSLAGGVVQSLCQVADGALRVAVIGRSMAKASRLALIANARAAMFGTTVRCEPLELKQFEARAFSRVLRTYKPKIIFQAASMQSPWEAAEGENGWTKLVAAAGFGITLPLQMAIAAEVSLGAGDTEAAIINASYPDGVNVALHRLGLRTTCGIGNSAIVEAFCRSHAKARNADVRVIGHHGHLSAWLKGERGKELPRVWVNGREMDAHRLRPKLQAIGEDFNHVTSSTAMTVILSLLTGVKLLQSIPGVAGLPGGYPFTLKNRKFTLRLPRGVTLEQAIAHNKTGERLDGLELGSGVQFIGKAREALASAGFEFAQGFAYGEWAAARDRMLALRERLRLRSA